MPYPSFPYSPLPIGVELNLGGTWTDITADVDRAGLSCTRGRSDESATVGPGSFKFKVRNPTGKYSPRNPAGPLYGLIGRNTPARYWAELGRARSVQPDGGAYWETADKAALDITGDIDLRVDLKPTTWRPALSSWIGVLKNGAYGMFITSAGVLVLNWNDSGGGGHSVSSTQPIPGGTVGRKQLRATLDVNNGAAGHTVVFYIWQAGAWVQFGDAVTVAGVTSIINSTGNLRTYTNTELGSTSVYSVQVRQGINGTLKANPIFTAQSSGTTSFADGLGNTYAPVGGATLTNRHYRINSEVAEWPARWSEKGAPESFVEVEAAGTLRRLSQGQAALRSALYRGSSTLPSLTGYWPMEEGQDSTGFEAFGTARRGGYQGVGLEMAAYTGITASDALPQIKTSKLIFRPNAAAITGQLQVRWVMNMPTAPANGTVLARIYTSSTLAFLELTYGTGDSLTLTAWKDEATLLGTAGPYSIGAQLRTPLRFSVECTQSGSNVSINFAGLSVGQTVGWVGGATTSVCTLGVPTLIYINPDFANLADTAIGHVTAQTAVTSLFDLSLQLNAYNGENALTRITRLASENGLDLEMIGVGGLGGTCGPQRIMTLLDLLREAASVDGGVLYEPDSGHTLAYRPLDAITGQTPTPIAYVENMFRPFEPTEDDQNTRNSVTVTRQGAGSATAEQLTGPLGVNTIGRYAEDVTLNLRNDLDAEHQAAWRLNLGTVDDMRWPKIGFNMADPRVLADPDLVLTLLELDIGDRLTITDLPDWLPPLPADVIVQGISETVTPDSWQIELNTSPAMPFDVDGIDWLERWDNDRTTLNTTVTAGATSWSVKVDQLPLWSIADGAFDVMCDGERVTVTNVTGASSPQTFTVTRAVNGISKAHTAGVTIELADPTRYSL